jgi:selenocysteine lyase/cysteine desulfurase
MLRLPDRHPGAETVAALRARGVTSDSRGQTLRLSPGILTTEAGTETLLAALAEVLA